MSPLTQASSLEALTSRPIYLDYHATTPIDPRARTVMLRYLDAEFGNASSRDHAYGEEAEAAVMEARRQVALLVGVPPRWVVFTSGATESLNLALQGFVRAKARIRGRTPVRIALPRTEHRAVLETVLWMEEQGLVELLWIPVDGAARINLDALKAACARDGAELICAMAASNEVGTIHPLEEIGHIARAHDAVFLTDATQAAGKIPLDLGRMGTSLVALSAHKMYGPKGVGALLADPEVLLDPLFRGGGHERGLRSGTLNVPAIAGFGEACRLRRLEMADDEPCIAALRDRLQCLLMDSIPGLVVNGDVEHRLAGNLHFSVPGVLNSIIIANLRGHIALATGSACSSAVESPSHVLATMGLPPSLIRGSLRIGLGKFTTRTEIDAAARHIAGAVTEARAALAPST